MAIFLCFSVASLCIGGVSLVLFSPAERLAAEAGDPGDPGLVRARSRARERTVASWFAPTRMAARREPDPMPFVAVARANVEVAADWREVEKPPDELIMDAASLESRVGYLEAHLLEMRQQLAEANGWRFDTTFWMPGWRELLGLGDEGPAVLWLQQRMRRLGEYYGSLDGVYRTSTKDAVVRFQQRHSLRVDGVVGLETRGKIYEILGPR